MSDAEVDITGTVFDTMRLSDDHCFLCGDELSSRGTREHVFPRWLQRRYDLWDQQLVLLNGTTIPYRQLTIPCCSTCNSQHLGDLESTIQAAIESGYEAVAQLPPLTIYQWVGKIVYGIMRKELGLLRDRRDRDSGPIMPQEILEDFSNLHLFLQSVRQPFVFPDAEPFSVLVVNLHSDEEDYHFCDNLVHLIAAFRLNDVGLIVTLQDAGVIANTYSWYVEEVAGRQLHPIQFEELYAKCLYQMSLFTRTPKFVIAVNDNPAIPTSVNTLPIAGLNAKPILDEWDQAEYSLSLIHI